MLVIIVGPRGHSLVGLFPALEAYRTPFDVVKAAFTEEASRSDPARLLWVPSSATGIYSYFLGGGQGAQQPRARARAYNVLEASWTSLTNDLKKGSLMPGTIFIRVCCFWVRGALSA